jgi:hypothetical protein
MKEKNIYLQSMRRLTVFLLILFTIEASAQQKTASISGRVLDENENPLANVSIVILGKTNGNQSSDSGTFTIKVTAEKPLALTFSHTGYAPVQKNFFLSNGENEYITVYMKRSGKVLETVIISDERERRENSLVKINPKTALILPSTTGGVESLIKTLVGSNNELSSQYSVRGGNYDENLVYINDFEIYRPYLVSSGQQEGLSFINPELVKNVSFYTGGFQSKYGDKMSSVLDIQYKKPAGFGGTAYVSLLEQGFHLEATAKKGASKLPCRCKQQEQPQPVDSAINRYTGLLPPICIRLRRLISLTKLKFKTGNLNYWASLSVIQVYLFTGISKKNIFSILSIMYTVQYWFGYLF